MKIGLVGPTYQQISLPFDAQRTINLFPIMDQTGKEVASLEGTPGLILFGNLGNSVMRGEFAAANGRNFAVCGSGFFEVSADGTGNQLGSLNQSNGNVFIEENGVQIGICDGTNIYVMDYLTDTFKQITGGIEYINNGNFTSGTGWTTGTNWTISGGFAKATNATSDLSATAASTLISGQSYTLEYEVDFASYVTNGLFQTNTGWTLGTGWIIAGGVASATATTGALSQTAPENLVSGEIYTVIFTVVRTAGTISVSLGGGTAVAISASGTYSQQITAGATQIVAFTGASAFTGTLSNVTITLTGSGTVTPWIGGVAGITRSAPGAFTEIIVAGAGSQVIKFTGSAFIGNITAVTVNDQAFGLPSSVGSLTFLDAFGIATQNGTGHFFKSAANDLTSWNALDFATAESSPDNLVCAKAAVGQLWLQGTNTTEIWTNTGASSFPFQKISGGKMNMGILAAATSLELDNTLFWVGRNQQGKGVVYRAAGFTPRRISTEPMEIMIRAATDPSNMRAYSYQQDGHLFYLLTGGGLKTSLVYDITTDMWHERAYLNSQGQYEQHLGCCYMNAFGFHLVGDRTNGNIYIMDTNTYSDNGLPLSAERIFPHISDEAKRVRYNSLTIGAESGVGLQNGQGKSPVIELQLSKDGARTWSDSYFEPIGRAGDYLNKAEFRRLGVAETMTFKVRITDPVKRSFTGAYLN